MADVVVVFSHPDLHEALALRALLEREGIAVFGPPMGREPWPDERTVLDEIARAIAVVVIWSPRSVGDVRVGALTDEARKRRMALVTLITRDLDIATLKPPLSATHTAWTDEPRQAVQAVLAALGRPTKPEGSAGYEGTAAKPAAPPMPSVAASAPAPSPAPSPAPPPATPPAPAYAPAPAPPPAPPSVAAAAATAAAAAAAAAKASTSAAAPVASPSVATPAPRQRVGDLDGPEFLRPAPAAPAPAAPAPAAPASAGGGEAGGTSQGLSLGGLAFQRGVIDRVDDPREGSTFKLQPPIGERLPDLDDFLAKFPDGAPSLPQLPKPVDRESELDRVEGENARLAAELAEMKRREEISEASIVEAHSELDRRQRELNDQIGDLLEGEHRKRELLEQQLEQERRANDELRARMTEATMPRHRIESALPPTRHEGRGRAVAATVVVVGAVGLAYAVLGAKFFGELADKLLAVIGLAKGALPPGPAVAPPAEVLVDLVDCSVFAPPRAAPKAQFMVQVFLHLVEQAERVVFMATTMDDGAKLRGVKTLQVPIARGTHVRAVLEGQGIVVDEPVQELIWRGEPNVAAFSCVMAAASGQGDGQGDVHAVVRLYVGEEPVGRVLFKMSVSADADRPIAQLPEMTGTSARRYKQAFLSYASEDRVEVLKRAQALALANVGFFQDVLSLSPGERYERQIYEKIGEADLFMLFWSRHAMASEWVAKEIAHARACQQRNPQSLPDIVPVVLDDPRDAPPPELVGDHHFNDTIAALISYEQARRSGRGWSWRGLFRSGR